MQTPVNSALVKAMLSFSQVCANPSLRVSMPAPDNRVRRICICSPCCWPACLNALADFTAALNSRVMARVGWNVCYIFCDRAAICCCVSRNLLELACRPVPNSRKRPTSFCWAFSSFSRSFRVSYSSAPLRTLARSRQAIKSVIPSSSMACGGQ